MEGSEEKFGTDSLLLSLFVPYNLHVQCKHLNRGGCGVAVGVTAKSLLQKTEKNH